MQLVNEFEVQVSAVGSSKQRGYQVAVIGRAVAHIDEWASVIEDSMSSLRSTRRALQRPAVHPTGADSVGADERASLRREVNDSLRWHDASMQRFAVLRRKMLPPRHDSLRFGVRTRGKIYS